MRIRTLLAWPLVIAIAFVWLHRRIARAWRAA